MDRRKAWHGGVWTILVLAAALPAGGCTQALLTAAWLAGADAAPAETNCLNKKRVAIVCRPLTALQYQDSRVAKDLALHVGRMLAQKGKKVQVVDQQKVESWADEHTWEEYSEVGKAVKAQMVLGIDLEHFTMYEGQTLYQGKANVTLRVYDCEDGNKLVFEKTLPQTVWPPNACISTSERQPAQFRREFLGVLAERIGRHFYGHDPYDDAALDATAL